MSPSEILRQTERQLAAWYCSKGTPPADRLEKAAFHDPAAVAILQAIEAVEAESKPVCFLTVQRALSKANGLPCEIGEMTAILGDPEATGQPDFIADAMASEIHASYAGRLFDRELAEAVRQREAGGDPVAILAKLQTHHLPSFGSLGSFDPEPFTLEPFPTLALPSIAVEMVREIARVAMVPESLAGASVLGVLSASIGWGLRVQTYKAETSANLFLLAVAASGTGKDSALNLAAAPLFEIEAERLERWTTETRPDLQAELRRVSQSFKSAGDDPTELRRLERRQSEIERQLESEPALVIGDTTKEALGVALAGQPSECVAGISAEARGILATLQGRYVNGSDEDIFCASFSGTPTKVNRIGRPAVRLQSPCLSLAWMIQPDAFRKLAGNSAMLESGFLPRFLFFDSQAEPLDVPEDCPAFDPGLAKRWRALIRALVEVFLDAETPAVANPTREASERLRAFDNETRSRRRTGGDLADVAAFAARWPEIAWRVALVFHAVEYRGQAPGKPLELSTAENAIAIVEWFAGEALRLLESVREDRRRERKARLRELLEGAEGNRIRLRDLAKSHGFDSSEVEAIAKRENWLEIRAIQNPGGGPRSPHAILKRP